MTPRKELLQEEKAFIDAFSNMCAKNCVSDTMEEQVKSLLYDASRELIKALTTYMMLGIYIKKNEKEKWKKCMNKLELMIKKHEVKQEAKKTIK